MTERQIQEKLQNVYNSVIKSKNELHNEQEFLRNAFCHALMGVVLCADALDVEIEEVKDDGGLQNVM